MGEFGDHLKTLRKRAGLSQQGLAERIGADDSYVSRIERGIYPPPDREKLLTILEALDVTDKDERKYLLLAAGCASLEDVDWGNGKQEGMADRNRGKDEAAVPVYASPLSIPRTRILASLIESVEYNLEEAVEGLQKLLGGLDRASVGLREVRELLVEMLNEEKE
jgi:transcriptional regulator with XRE-family HTH domain